jgi:hypothetical protein
MADSTPSNELGHHANFVWRHWSKFLEQFFGKCVTGIKSKHKFVFKKASDSDFAPGRLYEPKEQKGDDKPTAATAGVVCKSYVDCTTPEDESLTSLLLDVEMDDIDSDPPSDDYIKEPTPIQAERKWWIHHQLFTQYYKDKVAEDKESGFKNDVGLPLTLQDLMAVQAKGHSLHRDEKKLVDAPLRAAREAKRAAAAARRQQREEQRRRHREEEKKAAQEEEKQLGILHASGVHKSYVYEDRSDSDASRDEYNNTGRRKVGIVQDKRKRKPSRKRKAAAK